MNILMVSQSFINRESIGNLFIDVFHPTEIKVVSSLEGLDNRNLYKLDFAFIDVKKDNVNIVEVLSNIKNVFKRLRIIVLDSSRDRELFFTLTKLGIDGYIIEISDEEEFIYIVKRVIRGKKFYDSELLNYVLSKHASKGVQNLTNRELDVLKHVSKGLTNREIANNLQVTDYTIKKHVSKILSKLNLRNRQDILVYTKEHNL